MAWSTSPRPTQSARMLKGASPGLQTLVTLLPPRGLLSPRPPDLRPELWRLVAPRSVAPARVVIKTC
eukprot:7189819-Alexandrium_andersonii.AAC.1